MIGSMKIVRIAAVVATAAVSAMSQYGDGVLAMVGKKVITAYELNQMVKMQEMTLSRQFSGEELAAKMEELRRNSLETMIEHELCYLEFQEMKAKVPPDYLQQRINELVEQHANGSVAKFEEQLQKDGTNVKEFKERLEKDIAVMMLVNDRTKRGNIVSEREIEQRYEKEKGRLATDPEYHIGVIQLRKDGRYGARLQETVDGIYAKLREGTPFAELAKEYSEGANAENGGDQGWMKQPNEKLLEVIKTLEAGQTASKPVELGSSLYIVRLEELKKGGVPPLDDEMKKIIRNVLLQEESLRRYKAFISELYLKHRVRRFDAAE